MHLNFRKRKNIQNTEKDSTWERRAVRVYDPALYFVVPDRRQTRFMPVRGICLGNTTKENLRGFSLNDQHLPAGMRGQPKYRRNL